MAQAPSLANDKGARTLPEVSLRWNDFMWALERLRHRRYGKKMRERLFNSNPPALHRYMYDFNTQHIEAAEPWNSHIS